MNISKAATGVVNAPTKHTNTGNAEGSPAGRKTRRNANKSKLGDGEGRRPMGPFQQHNANGDEGHDNITGYIRVDPRHYSYPFEGQSDDGYLNLTHPSEMIRGGEGSISDFDSPSASRNDRRIASRFLQEQHNGRKARNNRDQSRPNDDSGDDFGKMDDGYENHGYGPRQFQRVTLTSGLPEPRFPIVPTTPAVKGRVVKQALRRGRRPFAEVSDNEDATLETSDYQDSNMDEDEYYEQARYRQDESPDYDTPMAEVEDYDGDEDEYMFVSEPGFRRPNRVEKNRAGGVLHPSNIRPTTNATASEGSLNSHPAARRGKKSGRPRILFNNPGEDLAPSRYSGAIMPWGINQQPVLVDQETVSDAHLKKRGLKRPPPGEKVGKRSYGANDPENVAIVNMKENEGKSFAEIAEFLNAKRVSAGLKPGLTVCGVNGRYNRTAPILFATQGLKFVPLSERRKANGAAKHGSLTSKAGWTAEAEDRLVDIVKQVEAEKWTNVARKLNLDLYNGQAVYDATACAKRYAAI
ncbi:f198d5fd-cedc-4f75-8eac-c28f46a1cfed-CDS [Sclerotinia trifoliorum]|uniref:F198d5fd-cedc-4f75-8eac-c28f46a1cfed-CDS n=1 Tax=Sclerotinia trifoliorum TaxID=28548 RepID=A0A8H2VSM1_9HELO|nr:f198d5fd-cedc-4f75-8eac-c28f46a1cfed-CDS [Sclerotinia trifoliorum]